MLDNLGIAFLIAILEFLPLSIRTVKSAQDSTGQTQPREVPAGLEEYIQSAMRDWGVPGLAIAVVKDGSVVLARGFGVRNMETGAPVSAETVFGIGSVTKSFTATALAMLVDEHKVSWDAPVKDYVPQFQTYDPYVTSVLSPRDIACHRTGIELANYLQWRPIDRADNAQHPTRDDIVRAFKYLRPSEGFRTTFAYKNNTWIVAGAVIEAASGMTWDRFVHERIFAPLGMKSSSTSVNETDGLPNVAAAHVLTGGRLKAIPLVNADVPGPMGSINSTVLDMAKYIRFHFGDGTFEGRRLLSASGLAELHQPQIIDRGDFQGTPFTKQVSYALGWWVQDYRGHTLVHHSGVIVGGNADVAYIPEEHLGVVVLINANALPLVGAISRRVLDAYLGAEPFDWNGRALALKKANDARTEAARAERELSRIKGTKPSLALGSYAGVYHNNAYGNLHIVYADGKLTARLWTFTGELTHWNYDTFSFKWDARHYYLLVAPDPADLVRFEIDERGIPSQMSFLSLGTFVRADESISQAASNPPTRTGPR